MLQIQKGSCFCGAVELMVTGVLATASACHCSACRSWTSTPVEKVTFWKPETVKVVRGEGNIGVYHKTAKIYRKFCKICGSHLMTSHARQSQVDVYAATVPARRHMAIVPATSAETVLNVAVTSP